jgi:hypothetical protein
MKSLKGKNSRVLPRAERTQQWCGRVPARKREGPNGGAVGTTTPCPKREGPNPKPCRNSPASRKSSMRSTTATAHQRSAPARSLGQPMRSAPCGQEPTPDRDSQRRSEIRELFAETHTVDRWQDAERNGRL